ncbi:MAG TPA: hypothetical protein DDW52_28040 [Planctomycetaceae bacterium]|nr:hypothetical protein [Planctomycetaceae bacterium]
MHYRYFVRLHYPTAITESCTRAVKTADLLLSQAERLLHFVSREPAEINASSSEKDVVYTRSAQKRRRRAFSKRKSNRANASDLRPTYGDNDSTQSNSSATFELSDGREITPRKVRQEFSDQKRQISKSSPTTAHVFLSNRFDQTQQRPLEREDQNASAIVRHIGNFVRDNQSQSGICIPGSQADASIGLRRSSDKLDPGSQEDSLIHSKGPTAIVASLNVRQRLQLANMSPRMARMKQIESLPTIKEVGRFRRRPAATSNDGSQLIVGECGISRDLGSQPRLGINLLVQHSSSERKNEFFERFKSKQRLTSNLPRVGGRKQTEASKATNAIERFTSPSTRTANDASQLIVGESVISGAPGRSSQSQLAMNSNEVLESSQTLAGTLHRFTRNGNIECYQTLPFASAISGALGGHSASLRLPSKGFKARESYRNLAVFDQHSEIATVKRQYRIDEASLRNSQRSRALWSLEFRYRELPGCFANDLRENGLSKLAKKAGAFEEVSFPRPPQSPSSSLKTTQSLGVQLPDVNVSQPSISPASIRTQQKLDVLLGQPPTTSPHSEIELQRSYRPAGDKEFLFRSLGSIPTSSETGDLFSRMPLLFELSVFNQNASSFDESVPDSVRELQTQLSPITLGNPVRRSTALYRRAASPSFGSTAEVRSKSYDQIASLNDLLSFASERQNSVLTSDPLFANPAFEANESSIEWLAAFTLTDLDWIALWTTLSLFELNYGVALSSAFGSKTLSENSSAIQSQMRREADWQAIG